MNISIKRGWRLVFDIDLILILRNAFVWLSKYDFREKQKNIECNVSFQFSSASVHSKSEKYSA